MYLRRDEPVTFHVRSPTLPVTARVLVYDDVAEGETPDVDQARSLDCSAGRGCTTARDASGFSVVLVRQPHHPAVAVLLLTYPTFEPADLHAGIAAYSASWVVQVRPT